MAEQPGAHGVAPMSCRRLLDAPAQDRVGPHASEQLDVTAEPDGLDRLGPHGGYLTACCAVTRAHGRDTLPPALVRTRFAPSPTGYLHIGGVRTALFNWLYRPPPRRQLRPADRRHRRAAQRRRGAGADPGGLPLARDRLGRGARGRRRPRAVLPVAARGALPARRRAAARRRPRLPRLRHAGGAPGRARGGRGGRRAFRLQPPLARRRRRRARPLRGRGPRRRRAAEDAARGRLPLHRPGPRRRRVRVGARAGPRDPARRRQRALPPGERRRRQRDADHARDPRRGAPVEHAAPDLHRRGPGLRAAGVRPPALRRRAGQQEQAEQAQAGQVPEEPRLRPAHRARPADRRGDRPRHRRRDVQPGDRRLLRDGRLPARGAGQLPAAARLVARRPDRVSRRDGDDRALLARAGARPPASFDPAKLESFQEHYMRQLPAARQVELCLPFLERAGLVPAAPDGATRAAVTAIVEAAGDRIKVAGDILDYADFFIADEALPYDDKAFDKRLRKPAEAAELLAGFRDRLAAAERFDAAALEALLRDFVDERDVKIGQVIHALRVAVTGKAVGFGMFETLEILGRERCLARIDRALARL